MNRIVSRIFLYFTLLRPYQWVKNILVFSGLIFSTSLFKSNTLGVSLAAFWIFCMASSGIYILNDLCDLKSDQLHPVKKRSANRIRGNAKRLGNNNHVVVAASSHTFFFPA